MKENNSQKSDLTLAIETSGRLGSVALGRGNQFLAQSEFSGFMQQAAELFPHIQNLLDRFDAHPADIKTVIITIGPGSFTGLRIAVTAAKMLYFAQKTKIVAVDSTDVIAQNAPDCIDNAPNLPVDCICTILDAKRSLFYASLFDRTPHGWQKSFGTQAVTADDLLDRVRAQGRQKVYFLGEGLVYYAKKFDAPFTSILDEKYWMPKAAGLYRIGQQQAGCGQFADPHTVAPLYIRKPDAVAKTAKRPQ